LRKNLLSDSGKISTFVVGMEPVEEGAHVHCAAADAGGDPAQLGAYRPGGLRGHHRVRLAVEVGEEEAVPVVRQLVRRVVFGPVAGAFFEDEHVEARPRKGQGQGTTPGAAADDHGVADARFQGRSFPRQWPGRASGASSQVQPRWAGSRRKPSRVKDTSFWKKARRRRSGSSWNRRRTSSL
jgi:hypothetical protein